MTERDDPTASTRGPGRYEIRLRGRLDAHWEAWFDGLAVSHENDGITVISGRITDQAALHGVLQRVRDLGLPLDSVKRIDDALADPARPDARERTTQRQGD